MKLETAPENILRAMSPTDRKGVKTAEERLVEQEIKGEGDLHKVVCNLLRLRDITFIHPPFGKRSQLPEGFPDLTLILRDRVCFIELKTLSGVISKEQHLMMERLRGLGFEVIVATDLVQVQAALNCWNVGTTPNQPAKL